MIVWSHDGAGRVQLTGDEPKLEAATVDWGDGTVETECYLTGGGSVAHTYADLNQTFAVSVVAGGPAGGPA